MKMVVDSHTHTIASAHAYSTVIELAKAGSENGLEVLAITDHAPALEDSSPALHFMNYHILPKELYGVKMLYGVELNILDFKGNVDLDNSLLERQDICIASFHTMCTKAGTKEENTSAYLGVMDNPFVNIIGHPEDGNIPVDFERLVKKAKERKILLEINNSSLKTAYFRKNTRENMCEMLELCRKMNTPIVLGTDSHFAFTVGQFDEAIELLKEINFPEELIANTSAEKYLSLLAERRKMI